MNANKTIDIIKKAILLEHRGKALYESTAEKTDVAPVRELFKMLAEEETKHIEILNKQFVRVSHGESFDSKGLDAIKGTYVDPVLSGKIVKGISGAGYEAAVIAASLEFEKNAVAYYGEQEKAAQSADEKQLFNWLVRWETDHMTMLAAIDNEIKEQIWYDNQFWPLD